jgi:L-seryl-tRNA(Ser) seleniumtransferase
VAIFNRASAGIVATILALVEPETTVISVSPGNRPHPSIRRGTKLANAELINADSPEAVDACLSSRKVSLMVITGVTSELDVIDAAMLRSVIERADSQSIPTFLDDAYGARLRPIVYDQPKSLRTGADIAVTSCDKAGFGGPRAGLMAGRPDLVDRVAARASELGLEARPPLALGVYESIVHFDPDRLRKEVQFGELIYSELASRYGSDRVRQTGLGAAISEEDAMEIVHYYRKSHSPLPFVPAEITAGIGMFWLYRYGIITVNAMGQPGARVSLRFKPDPVEIERFGGINRVLETVDEGFQKIAKETVSIEWMKKLILGHS